MLFKMLQIFTAMLAIVKPCNMFWCNNHH